mmetsp:Transcript_67294/g.78060  ORF Transcript_67294/g.78060 Transcript_67294/m.78060 type:complete len:82 (+) Transcript_67294:293-538(+)
MGPVNSVDPSASTQGSDVPKARSHDDDAFPTPPVTATWSVLPGLALPVVADAGNEEEWELEGRSDEAATGTLFGTSLMDRP